jgi:hypothetical protein
VPLRTPVDATAVGPGRKLAHVAKRAPQLLSALPTNPVLHRRSTYFHRRHLSGLAACGSHPKPPATGSFNSIGIEHLRRGTAGLVLARAGPHHSWAATMNWMAAEAGIFPPSGHVRMAG